MSKIWYCPTCGYEIESKGRCHRCRQKLVASPLPPLPVGDEDEEVGYRIEDWEDRTRGKLIERLVAEGIVHRFEDDELVVAADDESRVDELVVEVVPGDGDMAPVGVEGYFDEDDEFDEVADAVRLLYRAAQRLRVDPTDMEADGEVAEASAGVFMADEFDSADVDTWAAVGRVTRRLLAALGSDDALDDEIRQQAAVLVTLLRPVVDGEGDGAGGDAHGTGDVLTPVAGAEDADADADGTTPTGATSTTPADAGRSWAPTANGGPSGASDRTASADHAGAADDEGAASAAAALGFDSPVADSPVADSPLAATDDQGEDQDEDQEDGDDDAADLSGRHDAPGAPRLLGGGPETSYEAPEWMPEQRALLTVLLEERSIPHLWDGTDLVVPSDDEAAVEELFDQIGGVSEDDDDETRYRALEDLFAAVDRLANDPADEAKGADVVAASGAVEGPTPLGFDDGQWLALRRRVRTLADALEHDAHADVVAAQAIALRDTLRQLV